MAAKFSVVGKPVAKVGAAEIVTGKAEYTTDVELPGMLFGKILSSPHAHARIKKIDVSKAERLPGVVKVITYKDVPDVLFNPSIWYPNSLDPKDKRVLNERVRSYGEPVAVVAAVDEDTAEEALELIDVVYEVLPAVFDPEEAMKPEAPKLHRYERNIAAHVTNSWGDLEKGFKESDFVFEDRYVTSRQAHCSMEPHACLASLEGGKLTIFTGSQVHFKVRRVLSDIFDLPLNKIRLVSYYIGGGFGSKDEAILEPVCSLLTIKTGKPVKITMTRAEVFYATTTRHPAIIKVKAGVKKDGTLVAMDVKAIINTGAYGSHGPVVAGAMCFEDVGMYRTPNYSCEIYVVYTNTPIAGAFRGYGNSQMGFAVESHLDSIAAKLGIDPVKFRMKNAIKIGEVDRGSGRALATCGLEDCIKKSLKKIDWNRSKPQGNPVVKRGVGMAIDKQGSGAAPALEEFSGAFVKINEDGTVFVASGAVDIGQGISTTMAQIAAEVIGVPLRSVTVSNVDTDACPADRGAYASGTMYISGEAVKRAAEGAKKKLLEAAAKAMKVKAIDLEIVDGVVRVKKKPSVKKLLREVVPEEPIISAATFQATMSPASFGAHFVELEVDEETGGVKILKAICAHDVGRAINPAIVEGQIEGGYVQGMGYALIEDLVVDEKGKVPNAGFQDYKTYRASDLPKIESIIIETTGPTETYSARGVGEAPIKPSAPAIANAVYNATGIRLKELPITSEKILKAIKDL